MTYTTIISAQDLAGKLHDPAFVIFDCRHDLMNPEAGAKAYSEGHIPGARFAHTDRDLAAPKTGRNGRHPLPSVENFAAWLGRNGVDSSKQVVALRRHRRHLRYSAVVDATLARTRRRSGPGRGLGGLDQGRPSRNTRRANRDTGSLQCAAAQRCRGRRIRERPFGATGHGPHRCARRPSGSRV